MSEEISQNSVDTAQLAPVQDEVVENAPSNEPEEVGSGSETGTEEVSSQEVAQKTFSQEELDAIIGKRLAKEQRRWERAQMEKIEAYQAKQAMLEEIPSITAFESEDQHRQWVDKHVDSRISQYELQKAQRTAKEAFEARVEDVKVKYPDFDQVVYNDQTPISEYAAAAIQASDVGPDVAYYLGANLAEAKRIYNLPPLLQVKELGKIEAKLADNPTQVYKKVTKAADPINPVKAPASKPLVYDLNDPRSIETLSTSEWIALSRAQQRKKLEKR